MARTAHDATPSRGERHGLDGLRVEPVESLDSIRPMWSELADASANVFSTWEWATLWWRHFGDAGRLAVNRVRTSEGETIAILPLFVSAHGPVRLARLLGSPLGSRIHPVCAPAAREVAVAGLAEALDRLPADVFLADALPREEEWAELLPGGVVSWIPSPVIDLREVPSWDDYLLARSSNFRQDIRRKERKLHQQHDVVFRLSAERERLDEDIDTFFALHTERWASESSLNDEAKIAFHRDFAAVAFENGWLRLWFLEIDGVPAAAWYGYRFQGIETYYQAGRRLGHDDTSLGVILLAHTIREALVDGMGEYRLGPGGSPYKYRFTDDDPGLETVAVAGSLLGRVALRTQGALRRSATLRRAVRRTLAR